ncbi:MBL fold metallo-hydrolase [Novosphingobium sp.]|uniref:MBL fold metallo-hydrolase n=1 Tax=Novosphingobium sp. TaxID=1874826 RepID=UPI0025E2830F|nr:MBL fold metallo-hydrolase [Novosphingobium sp.]
MGRLLLLGCAILLPALLAGAAQATPAPPGGQWITLGTMGGPVANPRRSQPANVLLVPEGAILVDAGDGTAEQLAKAQIPLPQLRAVILSHLHWDHTGGLAALLGLRFQTNVPGALRIYGPPGTRALVAGLIASMQPGAEAGYGDPHAAAVHPADTVEVTELADASTTTIAQGVVLRTVQNTHFSFPPGSDLDRRYKSFAYRFDMRAHSIVYTGDTGPSTAVEQLAQGADLLVSEMIDLDGTLATVKRNTPEMDARALAGLTWHLTHHHLTPEQVGQLAGRAKVKRVVVTHITPGDTSPADRGRFLAAIRRNYNGPADLAEDLEVY